MVNNSWSGSRVTKLKDANQLFPSGCCNERTSSLHINNVTPDVILVYLGTNDWIFGSKTGNESRTIIQKARFSAVCFVRHISQNDQISSFHIIMQVYK